jgi:hypothetical protein
MQSGCGAADFSAAGQPVGGGEAGGFAGHHAGQAGGDVFEVVTRVDREAATVFDEGVEDRGFLAGILAADEEPVLGTELGGADGVFD